MVRMPGPFVGGAGIRLERRRSGLWGVYDGVYGVIPVGRGEPEGGVGSLKIGEKIEISASLCGSEGEICRKNSFLSFRQLENCRLGNFLSFRQFWMRVQTGLPKRTDAAFGWEDSVR